MACRGESELDCDRQFKQDLERAQALSLESLALENYRLQKQQLSDATQLPPRPTAVELKSRPRPGSFNSGAPRVSRMIAPPPAVPRRNSTTAAKVAKSNSDLITFSPSPTEKMRPGSRLLADLSVLESCAARGQLVPHQEISTPSPSTTATPLDILKVVSKRDNNNLIDLTPFDTHGVNDGSLVEVSVLEAFDPLLTTPTATDTTPAQEQRDCEELESQWSGSLYDPFDPLDYLYATSTGGSQADPVYAAVVKSPGSPPPLPPRNSVTVETSTPPCTRPRARLYENVELLRSRGVSHDADLHTFHHMVCHLRSGFEYSDVYTNVGLVVSPMMDSQYPDGTSIKLVVHAEGDAAPVTFTCDVGSTVEHVILHVVCELEGDLCGDVADYVLKVWGLAEYLTAHTVLSDYEHVRQCMKLERDVELALRRLDHLDRPLARTAQDDARDQSLSLEDLLPNEPVQPISYDTLVILLETLENEMARVQAAAEEFQAGRTPGLLPTLQPRGVVQAVKAVCALLGCLEPVELTEALTALENAGRAFVCGPEVVRDGSDYSVVTLRTLPRSFAAHCNRVREAVHLLLETYCLAFRVDFTLPPRPELPTRTSSDVADTTQLRVASLHRPLPAWSHDSFLVAAQVYHGTRPVGSPSLTHPVLRTHSLYERMVWDSWLVAEGTSVCMLPREARLVFVLYGQSQLPSEDGGTQPQVQQTELGWAAVQLFDKDGRMVRGNLLLALWPPLADKRLGPAPAPGTHPLGGSDPVLWVELPDYGSQVMFPLSPPLTPLPVCDFKSLDGHTRDTLMHLTNMHTFMRPAPEDREVLWEKRHYLRHLPQALPKVLLAAHSWDWACLGELHSMVHAWSPLEPVCALQLLLPCFPDSEVRSVAVSWLRALGSDELVDYLPQLLEALKHETWEASPLAHFLLERALTSPRVAHHLYWLLVQSLPGQFPQNSSEQSGHDEASVSICRYHRRQQLMLRALLAISGEALRERFMSQQLLMRSLTDIAERVKATRDSLRLSMLAQECESLHMSLNQSPTCLPLSPSVEVCGMQPRLCSYYPSSALPLRLSFQSPEGGSVPAIFKAGDDLRQDMVTVQMVRIMDKLWLREGLDLKMVTFSCVPTGHRRGMIEMVTSAETLRKIQVELGVTGSFKDRPIAEWLAKHNPSTFEYERAVDNFTASCAGYSVATYILGICDRHNDNIMLKTSGHLFHIDFGKFLGDAQMFGNFKRDRTPFVLTSDMAYVINGGDKPSARFHHFVDLCCQAFNVVRKHGDLLLNLFGLMASSGIPGMMEAVSYVQRALLPGLSNPEAAATFARMIQSSLKSWFTQFNFFLHNLAQLRFSEDHTNGTLLSFVPRTYTMQQDGRIRRVAVHGFQKRYDPEKYYVYILRVERDGQPDPTHLFRSYKEFCELHQKLCLFFPLAKCYSLPAGLSMGRSNIKQVAERRRADIERFLRSLFAMADEIAHSDVVYTFFHPLLRDQTEEVNIHAVKVRERQTSSMRCEHRHIRGQLKLSLHYRRDTLLVMVHHARSLPRVAGGQEPSTYVKVYLLPDPTKLTKRKTKVVRRSCHPTFMEMLEYRLPHEVVCALTLEATVWNHDPLQENEFLGCVQLPLGNMDLSCETVEWYPLGNAVPR